MFDMTKCKPGDALQTRDGGTAYYVGKCTDLVYSYHIRYDSGNNGSRTKTGCTFGERSKHGGDIIGFSQSPWRPLSIIRPADGQSVFLRIEKPGDTKYKHTIAPIRRRSVDGVLWMEVPK